MMAELFKRVQEGYTQYITYGKYLVLVFAALIYLWNQKKEKTKPLLLYGICSLFLVIFAPTAMALVKYQTYYYDYPWLFGLVPVTILIAWGAVCFLMECRKTAAESKSGKKIGILSVVLLLGILFLCGNMTGSVNGKKKSANEAEQALQSTEEILSLVHEKSANADNICIWGPKEALEYMRAVDPAVTLLYGRTMWEPSLGGYTYDTYSEEQNALYQWMEDLVQNAENAGTAEMVVQDAAPEEGAELQEAEQTAYLEAADAYFKTAFSWGVTCIVLPENTADVLMLQLEKSAEEAGYVTTFGKAGDYQIWMIERERDE